MARLILLLNATYEPLAVVALHRAVLLILDGKAEIVEETDERFRSPSTEVPVPAVIRLVTYARVPWRGELPLNRRTLLARDGGICQYCGRPGATVDHVVPRSRGGRHTWGNVVIACTTCNHRKADKLLSEIRWTLRRPPVAPKGLRWITLAVGTLDPAWEPYIEQFAGA